MTTTCNLKRVSNGQTVLKVTEGRVDIMRFGEESAKKKAVENDLVVLVSTAISSSYFLLGAVIKLVMKEC